jgi:hypothetical protein
MIPQPPIWLDESSDIRALLGEVVNRFDRKPGEKRTHNIVLRAEQFLPVLARNDAEADQTWALVEALQTLGVLVIHPGRRGAYDSPWVGARLKFSPRSETVLREWLSRPSAPSPSERWRAAVAQYASAFADQGAALALRRIAIPGKTDAEVVAAFASLAALDRPATMRQLSAYAFWGDSKVLDDRADLVEACFPQLRIRERKIVVAVHLPARIEGVLFIENQDTYAAAIEGEPAESGKLALVYVAGFRGAAARIRDRSGAVLHFSSEGCVEHAARFASWWFRETNVDWPLYFWGDLDFAGMQILKALRARFPETAAWQAGYARMLQDLQRMGAQRVADARAQTDPLETGCTYADEVLLPAIRTYGFRHQERVAD